MHCPKCKDVELQPTKIDDSLPVMGCSNCGGSSISLLYYRDWAERINIETRDSESATDIIEESDTKTALSCLKCSRLMTKFSVSGTSGNRIDLCTSCDEAWLDGGEWQLLKSLQLANKLPKIFTDQWQRKIRDEKSELGRIDRLRKVVGDGDTDKAIDIKKWLKDHPNKASILHFIGTQ